MSKPRDTAVEAVVRGQGEAALTARPEGPVDFLIIGAAKSATTWLQASLSANPGIFMPEPELHYFSRAFERGQTWYEGQFAAAAPGDVVGEKSNSYLTDPAAAGRIAQACPDVRLIVQMRDPVERAYSDYCMLFRRGAVSGDIGRHLDPDVAAGARFLNDGLYAGHIERYLRFFDRSQLLLLAYEDIRVAPERQLQRVAAHLGYGAVLAPPVQDRIKDRDAAVVPRPIRKLLAPLRPLLDPLRGRAPMRALRNIVARPVVYPQLTEDLAAKMRAFYRDDIRKLSELDPAVVRHWPPAGDPARCGAAP